MKKIIKTRTFWVAVIMGLLGSMESQTSAIQEFLSTHAAPSFGLLYAIVFPAVMIAMRLLTTTSVNDK